MNYDISAGKQGTKVESNRVMFYQAVHRTLRKKLGKDVKFSTYSCYFTEDPQLAKDFLEVVKRYNGKGNIYKAVKTE